MLQCCSCPCVKLISVAGLCVCVLHRRKFKLLAFNLYKSSPVLLVFHYSVCERAAPRSWLNSAFVCAWNDTALLQQPAASPQRESRLWKKAAPGSWVSPKQELKARQCWQGRQRQGRCSGSAGGCSAAGELSVPPKGRAGVCRRWGSAGCQRNWSGTWAVLSGRDAVGRSARRSQRLSRHGFLLGVFPV